LQSGGGVTWTWRVGPHTHSNAGVNYTRSHASPSGQESANAIVTAGLTHTISRRLSGTLQYRRLNTDGNLGAVPVRENSVTGTVNFTY
jgi:uncharacterized protein (PEP-CTERM system associated)